MTASFERISNMRKYILLILAVITIAPTFSNAQNNGFDLSKLQAQAMKISDAEFKKIDKNNDNRISKQEYINHVMEEARKKSEAAFKSIDQNNDDYISKAEYEDFMNFATGKIHNFFKLMKK